MTKKNDNTLLLVGGGLLAAVAIGALMLGSRPTGDGAGTETLPTGGGFFDKITNFGVHNTLGFSGGYTNPFADYLSGNDPMANPLAPKTFQEQYYGGSYADQYSHYTAPPATSSASDIASGYTTAGSTTPSPPPSTDTGFGVGGGKYYK